MRRPELYPTLEDNERVRQYPDVSGFVRNVAFFDHSSPETAADGDSISRSNAFEVRSLSA